MSSTGQTRRPKNCQEKRAVPKAFRSARDCTGDGEVGAYQADAVQTGISKLVCRCLYGTDAEVVTPYGNLTRVRVTEISAANPNGGVKGWEFVVGQRTADKTRPENVSLPTALYLGSPAHV